MAAKPPEPHHHLPRRWGPAVAPAVLSSSSFVLRRSPPSNLPIDFSPPLIAMVVVAAAAFLIVTYSRLISRHLFPPFLRLRRRYRRWRRRRRRRSHFPASDSESPPPFYESSDGFYVYSPYGLDDSVIKNIPLSIYKLPKSSKSTLSAKLGLRTDEEFHDCAVCLLEFEDGDYFRTLPLCSHSFHVDCIDIWLRSHATCPLCRAGVLVPPAPQSPLTPLMASRIRPSLDEGILLQSMFLEPLLEAPEQIRSGEIQPAETEDLFSPGSHRRELDFLLKRSYSFGFERSFPSERLVLEAATTPYHHHRHNRRRSLFWTKRPSSTTTPFSSIAKSRVFSFRQHHHRGGGMKSPAFFRRRGFFPMSESSASFRYGGGSSSRRMKYYMASSPVFGAPAIFSSSRMRCGDPEALISPERYNRR